MVVDSLVYYKYAGSGKFWRWSFFGRRHSLKKWVHRENCVRAVSSFSVLSDFLCSKKGCNLLCTISHLLFILYLPGTIRNAFCICINLSPAITRRFCAMHANHGALLKTHFLKLFLKMLYSCSIHEWHCFLLLFPKLQRHRSTVKMFVLTPALEELAALGI